MNRFINFRATTLLNLLTAAAFLAVAVIAMRLVYQDVQMYALQEAEKKATLVLHRNLAIHAYFNKQLKPSVFSLSEAYLPPDYFDPTWMSSTYAVREIDAYFKPLDDFGNYYYKEVAINARSPQNEADPFERAFLEELNQNPDLMKQSEVRLIEGQPYFAVLIRGEKMEAACMRCHGEPENAPAGLTARYGAQRSFQRREGETVSAISIHIPLAVAYASAGVVSRNLIVLLSAAFLALFLLTVGFQRRLISRPLESIRRKAHEITGNESVLGEQIPLPVGRELSDLTSAFNLLSMRLRQNRDELERRVSERTQALHESEQLIQEILNTTPTNLCLMNLRTNRFQFINRAMAEFFGCPVEALLETPASFLEQAIHPDDLPIYSLHFQEVIASKNGRVYRSEFRVKNGFGKWCWMDCRTAVFQRSPGGEPLFILHIGQDITERKQAEQELQYLGTHDALTGLYNRAFLQSALERLGRERPFPVSILMADIDNLKTVNDLHGHTAGDDLLQQVSQLLLACARSEDIVARIGGDEFIILLPGTDALAAETITARIRSQMAALLAHDSLEASGLSIGVCTAHREESLQEALARADQLMYLEKRIRKTASHEMCDAG